MTLILDPSHYKTRDALLEAGLKAELRLLQEGVTACVPRWLLQRSDSSSIGRTNIITQTNGIATGTGTGTFPPNNSPASSPSRNGNHNYNKENNHNYEKEEEDSNSSCGNGMLLNTQSAASFSYSDWNTVLPTIDWTRCEPNILCTVATDVWIPILQQLSNVAVVTTATTTADDFTNRINSNNPNQMEDIMANNTANHYRCCPHHFKVYHRLATILMGLAAMANHNNNNNNNNNDSDSVKTSRDDDCLVLLQQIRSLAQRILKESRMKGRYGATHYYCWFTAVAGECSEALGDLACAHLAYKSVGKLESTFHGRMTLLPVYGSNNVPISMTKTTTTTTTLINEQSESFDSNDGGVGRRHLGFPLGTRSNNHSYSNNASINKTVFPPPLLGAVIPPTLHDLAQHHKDHRVVAVGGGGTDTNTASNSKIGNRFVSTGSLMDRIHRTGSSDSLVVSSHDEISNGNNRNSSSSNNKTTSAVVSYHHSGSLLVGNFDTSNN
ncbi:hypothetical protein IV203_012893 [Nitzschia inconspicua]|uniref:Uncharacterized protein n=1 Tax=Nitzschia inconspicua TaxID=303405 RepID=A0A9K3Q7J3_9STRA|nr:hypothetical protein IV203_012893 [Nitzschia inconspicua]